MWLQRTGEIATQFMHIYTIQMGALRTFKLKHNLASYLQNLTALINLFSRMYVHNSDKNIALQG